MSLNHHMHNQTLSVAHRGNCVNGFVENTLESVAAALASGADLVEIDIQICATGEVIVLHDENLKRLWKLDAQVLETSWSTIKELRTKSGQRIPLLDDVLTLIRDANAKLLIDMDEGWPASAAARLVRNHGLSHKVAWCGTTAALAAVKQTDPSAEIFLPWQDSAVPEPIFVEPYGARTLNMSHRVATKDFIAEAHQRGYRVAVWTVDDRETMFDLIEAGVDAITTNRLDELVDVITSTNASKPRPDTYESFAGLSRPELDECLFVARGLGAWASTQVRTSPRPAFETKRDEADFVTELDVKIEARVRETILRKFPKHEFCGEESGSSNGAGGNDKYTWYLDPIDGTANLRFGLPWSSFSLGMARGNQPIVAVVVHVWTGETFTATLGQGAYLNGRRLGKVAVTPSLSHAKADREHSSLRGTAVLTEWANQHHWPGQFELMHELSLRDCTVRVMGSETLALANVAAGRASAAVIRDFNPVDHLAGALIVQEAGGKILNEAGQHDPFPEGGFMAISPDQKVAHELYTMWRESVDLAEREALVALRHVD